MLLEFFERLEHESNEFAEPKQAMGSNFENFFSGDGSQHRTICT